MLMIQIYNTRLGRACSFKFHSYLQIWEMMFWYNITSKPSFNDSRPLENSKLYPYNKSMYQADISVSHKYFLAKTRTYRTAEYAMAKNK